MISTWLIFIAVLLATGVLLSAILVVLMAVTLLRPNRMTDAKAIMVLRRLTPGDLKLKFADVRFPVRDERTGKTLDLAGWWIPAEHLATRTILLIHGYADAKVGAIAWAPTFHALGWNVLAVDLRAHGESPRGLSTAGYWERHDMVQVINQFRVQRPRETERFAMFGVSLGAAVATATSALRQRDGRDGAERASEDRAVRDARTGRDGSADPDAGTGRSAASASDIDAIILESPFADYRRAVAAHGAMRGMPGGVLRDAAIRLAERIARADFRAVRPMDLVGRLTCPVMVIHSGDDPFIPGDDASAMRLALEQRGNPRDAYWSVEDAGHVLGLAAAGPDAYRDAIALFLDGAMSVEPVAERAPVAQSS